MRDGPEMQVIYAELIRDEPMYCIRKGIVSLHH